MDLCIVTNSLARRTISNKKKNSDKKHCMSYSIFFYLNLSGIKCSRGELPCFEYLLGDTYDALSTGKP